MSFAEAVASMQKQRVERRYSILANGFRCVISQFVRFSDNEVVEAEFQWSGVVVIYSLSGFCSSVV